MYNHNSGTLETKEPNINLYTAAIVVTTTLSPANQKVTLILPEIKYNRQPESKVVLIQLAGCRLGLTSHYR